MDRRTLLRGAFIGAGLVAAELAFLKLTFPSLTAAAESSAISDYDGRENPAALQARIDTLSATQPVFVMYHATWCPHCRNLGKTFGELATESSVPFHVLKVDVDLQSSLAARNKQSGGVPEVHIYYQGRRLGEFVGDVPKESLAEFLDRFHAQVMQPAPAAPTPAP